jgi:hypothetical protein
MHPVLDSSAGDANTNADSRPAKRARTTEPTSTLTDLPPPILFLSLPTLFLHPPTHRLHPQSLYLSLRSLRRCLLLNALSPDIECRAWTALAEVGMTIVDGGFVQRSEHPWAAGVDQEVCINMNPQLDTRFDAHIFR